MESEDESVSMRPRSQQRGSLHKGSKGQRSSMYRKTQSLDHQLAEDRVSGAPDLTHYRALLIIGAPLDEKAS